MKRRTVVAGLAGAALFVPAVLAQRPRKVLRIGVLSSVPQTENRLSSIFLDELRALGWTDGQNVEIDWRHVAGQAEGYGEIADALVRANVDVIIASNPNALIAARRATASIPIVMVNTPDPVQLGIIDSLARPGGNITGTSTLSGDLSVKQLQLITDLLPGIVRITVIAAVRNPWHPSAIGALEAGARTLGVALTAIVVREPGEFERIFADVARERAQCVLVLSDPMTFYHRVMLAELGIRHRLATAYGLREHAEAGGLMSYWADSEALYRRTAAYVDRLFKGARAETLPVEQPTRYELVLNLKTAKALGIAIPPAFLAAADEVIE